LGGIDEPGVEPALPPAPEHIAELLTALRDDPTLHVRRKDKLGFLPSPEGIRKIEALRRLVDTALRPLSRKDLNEFCRIELSLSTSSVGALLTSMKATGLLQEVGPAVFEATPAGRDWLDSSEDTDLVRLLHVHVRFVGELLLSAKESVRSTELSAIAEQTYSARTAKQLLGLLEEAGLVEKTKYLHYRTTVLGVALLEGLPLAEPESLGSARPNQQLPTRSDELGSLLQRLAATARDPRAEEKTPGLAFEEAVAASFRFLGMKAEHIGGSGDTDVLVRFRDADGAERSAVVDAKSKKDGAVTAADIKQVNLGQHNSRHAASFGAVVGPGFGGNHITNWARDQGYALITVDSLAETLRAHATLGLDEADAGLLFRGQEGLDSLAQVIRNLRRTLDVVATVVGALADADEDENDDLERTRSPRDIRLETKRSALKPTAEELCDAAELLAYPAIGATVAASPSHNRTQVAYRLRGAPASSAKRLRALAEAIERGAGLDISDI
jgi:hypothetical protein